MLTEGLYRVGSEVGRCVITTQITLGLMMQVFKMDAMRTLDRVVDSTYDGKLPDQSARSEKKHESGDLYSRPPFHHVCTWRSKDFGA